MSGDGSEMGVDDAVLGSVVRTCSAVDQMIEDVAFGRFADGDAGADVVTNRHTGLLGSAHAR